MNTDLASATAASNALTARWVAELDTTADCLISGFSAWHLLSILAGGATGQAREELAAATNIDAAGGADGVNQLFDALSADVTSGVGLWIRPDLTLKQAFADLFPAMAIDTIPDDLTELDHWVSKATGGILHKFPVTVDRETRLAAASALGLDVPWQQRFTPGYTRWHGDQDAFYTGLSRSQKSRDNGAVIIGSDATLSRYTCEAGDNIDVHLIAGAVSDNSRTVLRTAIEAVSGTATIESLDALPVGTTQGCMTIEEASGYEDTLTVRLPAFHLDGDHDFVELADLFGLRTALDDSYGHFGHIATEPLAIDQVRQVAIADFTDVGFRAAAVTAASARAGGGPPADKCIRVSFNFDRPFGMLAVHRPTNLILFAGWIATTDALTKDEFRVR